MEPGERSDGRPLPSPDEARQALQRILASRTFKGARRSGDLLRFLVDAELAGRGGQLKEYVIGAEALGRGDTFDPRFDSIARVEASRLRVRLSLYYAEEGRADPIRITLPAGGYAPGIARAAAAISPAPEPAAYPPAARGASSGRTFALLASGAAATAAIWLATSLTAKPAPSVPRPAPLRVEARLGVDGDLWTNPGVNMALSRDGQMLVMSIRRPDGTVRLYSRRMNELSATELPGTEDAGSPCLSPDGQWVAFFSRGQLRKTLVAGQGSPTPLAQGALAYACSWGDDGQIYATLSNDGALWRVPAGGGAPSKVIDLGPAAPQPRWPSVLPGGKGLLFVATHDGFVGSIEAVRLDGRGRKPLRLHGINPHYLPSGHLLYNDGPQLLAVRFDPDRLETIGAPRKVVDDIAYLEFFGIAPFVAADDGTLLYLPGGPRGFSTLQRVDASGGVHPLTSQPARRFFLRAAPDGRHLVYVQADGSDNTIWLYDMERQAALPLTTEPLGGSGPGWSADGQSIFYLQSATRSLAVRRIDGGDPQVLLDQPGNFWSASPDGRTLAFQLSHANNQLDLFAASLTKSGHALRVETPALFYGSPASETQPAFSPDGRWIAYTSNESGQADVWVRPFGREGKARKISESPGAMVRWSQATPDIVYESRDRQLWRIRYRIKNGEFEPDRPVRLPHPPLADTNVAPNFDLLPDGKSLVILRPIVEENQLKKDHLVLLRDAFDAARP